MAYEKVTDRSALTSADDLDVLHVVDVSDTAIDAAGNSKKITVSNLMKSAPVQSADIANFATTTYVNTEVGNEETARITADSNLQIQINGNDTDIASLNTRVTTNENEIISVEGRVTTAEGDIGSLQTQVTSNDSDITSLNTRVTTNEGDISTLNSNTTTNATNITALDTRVTANEADITTLQAATHVNSFNSLTGAVTLLGGTDITLSTTGNQITINSTASGGGGGGSDSFNTIAVSGQSDVVADSGNDTLTLVAGTNVTITTNATTDSITFNVSNLDTDDVTEATNLYYTDARADARISAASVTDLSDVTSAGSGAIITTAERTKLNGIEAGAEVNPTATEVKTLYESNADTNAFTDAEQTKLAGIAAGAEVNVNADWEATSGDSAIRNKPNIPSVLVDTDDLSEGTTNLYYTDTRVQTYLTSEKIQANYPTLTVTGNTTLTATYEQTMVIGNSATGITFEVRSGLASDCEILVMQGSAGDITITGATGVTIRTTSDFQAVTGGQYAIIGLKQIGTTDEYIVTGERKPV